MFYQCISICKCRFQSNPGCMVLESSAMLVEWWNRFSLSEIPMGHAEFHLVNHICLEATTGFIASSMSEIGGCGSNACPWKLNVPKGQRLNISLYDFTRTSSGGK